MRRNVYPPTRPEERIRSGVHKARRSTERVCATGATLPIRATNRPDHDPPKGQRRVGHPNPRDKAPVLALVERGGRVRARHVPDVTAHTLRSAVRENVARPARIVTDEFNCYARLPRDGYEHETVCHSAGGYARGDVHTNTVEGFFALVKRGLYGTFHAVSRKHLHRYLGEFEFRYNTRWLDDGDRTMLAIQAADGRRLTNQQQVAR